MHEAEPFRRQSSQPQAVFPGFIDSLLRTERNFLDFVSRGKGAETKEAFYQFAVDRLKEARQIPLGVASHAIGSGYSLAKGLGNTTLDLVPGSRSVLSVARNVALPLGAFVGAEYVAPGAAHTILSWGSQAGQFATSTAGMALNPMLHNAPWAVKGMASGVGWLATHSAPSIGAGAAALYSGKFMLNAMQHASERIVSSVSKAIKGNGDKSMSANENKAEPTNAETTNQSTKMEKQPQENVAIPSSPNQDEPREEIKSAPAQPEQEALPPKPNQFDEQANETGLSVQQQLAQRGINADRFSINVDGKEVFKMRNGEITQSSLTAEQSRMIQTALNDPASLQGTVRITQGSRVLLHVKDGQVLADSLGMTRQAAKLDISTPLQGLYEKASQGIVSKGAEFTRDVANNALKMGADPKSTMEMIKSYDPNYKAFMQHRGLDAANSMVQKIVQSALAKSEVAKTPKTDQKKVHKVLQK